MTDSQGQKGSSDRSGGWLARRYLHLITGLAFFVIGGLYLYHTLQIRVPRIGDALGPRAFPLLLVSTFLTLTVLFLASAILGREERDDARDIRAQRQAWMTFGLTIAFVAVLPLAGYQVSVAVFGFLFLTTLGFGTVPINLGIAVAIAAGFQVVFVHWLGLPLPGSW